MPDEVDELMMLALNVALNYGANDAGFDPDNRLRSALTKLVEERDAAIERARKAEQACAVAQRWLSNCTPTIELLGPKPLPLLAAVLASAPAKG